MPHKALQLTKWNLLLACTAIWIFSSLAYADKHATENVTGAKQETTIQTSAQPSMTNGFVARAMFTSQIIDREPADELTELANNMQRIYFFSDLRGLTGQIITHKWELGGNVMAEVKFKVGGGPRWRVYSSKNLLPEWTGEWTVSVIDENGSTLNTSSFTYTAASSSDGMTSPD